MHNKTESFKKIKWVIGILICFNLLVFTACSSKDTAPETNGEVEEDGTTVTVQTKTLKDIDVAFPTEFHDGVAWCMDSDYSESPQMYLINKDGNILFGHNDLVVQKGAELGVGFCQFSSYSDGVSMAHLDFEETQDNTRNAYANALIDKEGKIIWSTAIDGWEAAEKYLQEYDIQRIEGLSGVYEDVRSTDNDSFATGASDNVYSGYMTIGFWIDSYEFTGVTIGVVDSKGNWVVEPGETKGNSMYELSAMQQENNGIYATEQFIVDYNNGEVTFFSDKEKAYNAAKQMESDAEYERHNGMLYTNANSEGKGYYNKTGEKVIDLSQYYEIENAHEFEDGYAFLEVKNEGGGRYMTIIDEKGNEMFPPVPNECLRGSELSEGFIFIGSPAEGYFIDVHGNKLETTDEYGLLGTGFSEGLAWLRNEDGNYVCINTDGKIVF